MKKERGVPVNRKAMDEYQFSSNPERERESELNRGRRRFTVSVCVKLKLNPAFALG